MVSCAQTEKCMYFLFLDDERVPQQVTWVKSVGAYDSYTWEIVRSFDQFVACVQEKGLPEFISFDHDLGDTHANERTGHTCAKWLVDYCLDHNAACPLFVVHSQNPEGARNIHGLLKGFQQFQNQNLNYKVKP